MNTERKALLLSVGYGRGHHSAARALADELTRRAWRARVVDVCAATHPRLFRLTQLFYLFCVRRAPRLWGALYKQIDSADWRKLIHNPMLRGCLKVLHEELLREQPDLVVCTYPLFAFMLDALAREEGAAVPYAVVVTDSLTISRPWVLSDAPLICLPDELSLSRVQCEFGLPAERLAAPGFPVRAAFRPGHRELPGAEGEGLHIVYGAHACLARVRADAQAMLQEWPRMRLTIVAEERRRQLLDLLHLSPGVQLCAAEQDMAELLRSAHLYIGKAGAASIFEAYSAEVPVLVNYALPGQEQGNLQLLQHDAAGLYASDTPTLMHALRRMLCHGASGWQAACAAMRRAGRGGGAARTAEAIERRFFS